jgi:hypothetical protein
VKTVIASSKHTKRSLRGAHKGVEMKKEILYKGSVETDEFQALAEKLDINEIPSIGFYCKDESIKVINWDGRINGFDFHHGVDVLKFVPIEELKFKRKFKKYHVLVRNHKIKIKGPEEVNSGLFYTNAIKEFQKDRRKQVFAMDSEYGMTKEITTWLENLVTTGKLDSLAD